MFRSSYVSLLVFGHFWRWSYENTRILRNLCLHFARQDGQDGKNRKEKKITQLKWPKTKRRKYGMNKTRDWCPSKKDFNTLYDAGEMVPCSLFPLNLLKRTVTRKIFKGPKLCKLVRQRSFTIYLDRYFNSTN